jgi:hypothetical protein
VQTNWWNGAVPNIIRPILWTMRLQHVTSRRDISLADWQPFSHGPLQRVPANGCAFSKLDRTALLIVYSSFDQRAVDPVDLVHTIPFSSLTKTCLSKSQFSERKMTLASSLSARLQPRDEFSSRR